MLLDTLISVGDVFKRRGAQCFYFEAEGDYGRPKAAWLISFVLTRRLCLVLADYLGAHLHLNPIWIGIT